MKGMFRSGITSSGPLRTVRNLYLITSSGPLRTVRNLYLILVASTTITVVV